MLDKYEDFFKLSKNEECFIYSAVSRETGQNVLLKRFKKSKMSWDEVLKSRSLQFSQRAKMFPKMVEIFKNKGEYYVVYEKPSGPSLANADTLCPLQLENFYPLLADLCHFLQELRQMNPMVWLLPEWIFIHRNSIKILHFQPFFPNKQLQSNDHVFIFKVQNNLIPTNNDNDSQTSIMPLDKKRNLTFNLGMICYYLLTGSKKPEFNNQDEYLDYVAELEQNAEKRIVKITKEKVLGQMVGKMLSGNVFQLPDFDKISSYFSGKAAEMTPKRRSHTTNIEIELEKITLQTSRKVEESDVRRKLRPCCAQKQASLQKINEENRQIRQQTSRKPQTNHLRQSSLYPQSSLQKRGNTFLPSIHRKGHVRTKTTSDLMNTTNSKPLMFANRSAIMKCD